MIKLGKRVLGIALASAVSVGGASAADIYTGGGYKDACCAPVTWTGFYVGLNGGGAWGDFKVTGLPSYGHTGAEGGAQFGWNWQRGNVVFGFEADVGGFDIGARKLPSSSIESGFYTDATLRLGYSFDRLLIYVKGGAAIYEGSARFIGVTNATNEGDYWGGTIGGGAEYMLSPTWSLKAEYMYYDFGSQAIGAIENDLTVSTFKVGVNLHFPPKFEPLK
jgi:outer membrane immunogenic protein